jgi:hypothetical protein
VQCGKGSVGDACLQKEMTRYAMSASDFELRALPPKGPHPMLSMDVKQSGQATSCDLLTSAANHGSRRACPSERPGPWLGHGCGTSAPMRSELR